MLIRDHGQHQPTVRRTSRFEGLDNFVLNLLLRPLTLVQLVAINTLARNADSEVINVSIVER